MATKKPLVRCPWVPPDKPDYVAYHDVEWGVPVHDDEKMFELLTLESAQAGLSWYTVLRKREGYRRAFAGFDVEQVARFGARDVERLMNDAAIIRNRQKINAAIENARRFLEVQEREGGFARFLWRFVDDKPVVHRPRTLADYPATTKESDAVSKELKARGFKFVGSTICYAHMQSAGLVNDHTVSCFRFREIAGRRR